MKASMIGWTRGIVLALGFCSLGSVRAQEVMTGFVAPLWSQRSMQEDSRSYWRLEFARLTRYVSLDFRYSNSGSYEDYGGSLRFFKHWSFQENSGTGVSAGVGFGATTSQPFLETFMNPFVRAVWDSRYGVGVVGEFGFEPILQRSQQKPYKKLDRPEGLNFSFAIGIAVSA